MLVEKMYNPDTGLGAPERVTHPLIQTFFSEFIIRNLRIGVSVEGESHEKAVELLKQSDKVSLVVRYTPHILEQMERRFEQMRASAARRRDPQANGH